MEIERVRMARRDLNRITLALKVLNEKYVLHDNIMAVIRGTHMMGEKPSIGFIGARRRRALWVKTRALIAHDRVLAGR